MADACCTCACIILPHDDFKCEKPSQNRRLNCCGRVVCGKCISSNPRFATYCPFCQIPTPLEPGAVEPPAYSASSAPHTPPPAPQMAHATLAHPPDSPPPYDTIDSEPPSLEELPSASFSDVLHHLSPSDSMTSLSLAYGVPLDVLRRHNTLFSDHLISARRTILVPGQHYQGPSLAPDPVEDEQETERKAKIRRLMVRCKLSDYEVAVLYLEQESWDLDRAIERWEGDEQWEQDHPMHGKTGLRAPCLS